MHDMNILIVKTSSLGDIVHTFPTIGLIKTLFPNSSIDWVVEKPSLDLVKAHPDIDQVIAIDTKCWRKKWISRSAAKEMGNFKRQLQKKKYDVVFDLQGNVKSGLITWFAKSPDKVGFARGRVSEWPNLLATNRRYLPPKGGNIRDEYLHLVHSYFRDFRPYTYSGTVLKLTDLEKSQLKTIENRVKESKKMPIMVCSGSNWKNKQLSDEGLQSFLKLLEDRYDCQFIFVWGTEKEKIYADSLARQFKTSIVLDKLLLPVLQHVMQQVKLVIAMDSLALHLAATTQTATFSIFGASLATKYKPMGKNHIAFQGNCPYGEVFNARCPKLRHCNTGACIRFLSGQAIFDEVKHILP